MTVLSKLKTSNKSKTYTQETNEQRLRRMLREKLQEQREIVDAELNGKQLIKTTIKYIPAGFSRQVQHSRFSRNASAGVL